MMTKEKKNLVPDLESQIDDLCQKHIEEKEILVRTSKIAGMIRANTERVRRQGFPAHWDHKYDACNWEYNEGLVIKPGEFLKEKYPERYGDDQEETEENNEVEK